MIEITNEYITNNQLNKAALTLLGADIVELKGDKIIFKKAIMFYTSALTSLDKVIFNSKVEFFYCTSLNSLDGATFNNRVVFRECYNLTSVAGASFNGKVVFSWCRSLASVFGATFNQGFKAIGCPKLKQKE